MSAAAEAVLGTSVRPAIADPAAIIPVMTAPRNDFRIFSVIVALREKGYLQTRRLRLSVGGGLAELRYSISPS
jgi:hypothetical protein